MGVLYQEDPEYKCLYYSNHKWLLLNYYIINDCY